MYTSSRMIFDSRDSVRDRLFNTYILYRGRFYYVKGVGDSVDENDFELILRSFDDVITVRVNNPEVVFQGFPLGFVNTNKGPFFISRTGLRQYKQGINSDNIVMQPIVDIQRRIPYNDYFYTCLAKTVVNDYPTLQTYVDAGRSGAFSRYFAKFQDKLYYKTKVVGYFVESMPILDEKYEYLKEALHEVINGTQS